MTVSRDTVERIVKLMLNNDKEFTTESLRRLSGYSQATVRQAISGAVLQGSVYKVAGSYPAKFRAVANPPQQGEIVVIKEPIPPIELNEKVQASIRKLLLRKDFNDAVMSDHLAKYYINLDENKRANLKDFLINFAEVIKQDLEMNKELDPMDIKVS